VSDEGMVDTSGLSGSFIDNYYKLPDSVGWDDWVRSGAVLQTIHKNINFWIGDWILFGESHFPETYSQAILLTGKSDATLRNCAWVASIFPPEQRRDLSFTHHFEVAGMDNIQDRDHLLDKAEEEDWSSLYLRKMRYDELGQTLPVMPEPLPVSVTSELQQAVSDFCDVASQVSNLKDQLFQVPFDWGYVEMRVVRNN
jgi:hypothetical protein|tara:strand:- start:124 stop:717 length:594 start_codon:yes stop_codon:yes gene_type:complete